MPYTSNPYDLTKGKRWVPDNTTKTPENTEEFHPLKIEGTWRNQRVYWNDRKLLTGNSYPAKITFPDGSLEEAVVHVQSKAVEMTDHYRATYEWAEIHGTYKGLPTTTVIPEGTLINLTFSKYQ